jgi:hypothetical protein
MLILSLLSALFLFPAPTRAARVEPVASYTIDVTLDVEAKTLTAHETIRYVNRTAAPIPDLVFHLYLNAFRSPDTLMMQESGNAAAAQTWEEERFGWVEVTSLRLTDGTSLTLEELADGTLARADLPAPVPPGEVIELTLVYEAQLPRIFSRTGYVGDFFMVGQWFPKLGVWEEGAWDAHPFHANSEFYADFGAYDVRITLPADYVTGATGLPVEETVHDDGTKTVHYHAEDVIDFAWTASPDFQEATRRVGDVEVRYLYLPEHEANVERALEASEAALPLYTDWYGPYPYERLTVVNVPDTGQGAGGMEYPTLITVSTLVGPLGPAEFRLFEVVVVHEIGHQWWQSMVAFNEAEEPWLDEGITDYSTARAMDAAYGAGSSLLDTGSFDMSYLDLQRAQYLSDPRVPMYGAAWEFSGMEYQIGTYAKPVVALSTLEGVLGPKTMRDVMRTFFQRYQFAHPTTEDFRAVAEEVSGEDLDWFFEGLVYGDGVLNYTVTEVGPHTVRVAREGTVRVPTEILVTFEDGSAVREAWDGRETERTLRYPDRPPIRSAQIDPEHDVLIDLRWADNGRTREVQIPPLLALAVRTMYTLENLLLLLGGL